MLANVKLRCPFCSFETTHGKFEGHKENCPQNPDAVTECTFCNTEYFVREEVLHQNICVPFLQDKIATLELKTSSLETENKLGGKYVSLLFPFLPIRRERTRKGSIGRKKWRRGRKVSLVHWGTFQTRLVYRTLCLLQQTWYGACAYSTPST